MRFGHLVVIERAPSRPKHKTAYWICRCDCGTVKEFSATVLHARSSRSCGCAKLENVKDWRRKTGRSMTSNGNCYLLLRAYENNAKQSNRSFSLTLNKFEEITSQNCHYCGSAPSKKFTSRSRNANATPYVYNGIDRKNNEIGYEDDNCLPCCWDCNQAKGSKNYEEFILWLDRVARFQLSIPIEVI